MSDDLSGLVLSCARAARDTSTDEIRRSASVTADWKRVIETASEHSLLPLLAARVGQAGVDIPQPLAEAAASAAARNLALAAETLRVQDLLTTKGIESIAFKGPVLSVTLYGTPALRQSTDIDLLVRRRQALAARRTLQEAGHAFWLDLTPRQETAFLRYSNEYGLRANDGQIVELSWALAPRHLALALDADQFFKDACAIELGGTRVAVLAPHDQLLALAVHGGKHLWERLGWITDVAQLLATTPDLDVDLALARARSAGAERLVLVAVAMCRVILAAELQPALSQRIDRDPAVSPLVSNLRHRLLPLGRRHHERILDPLTLRLRERIRDRATIVARLAGTATVEDWQWARLPDALVFASPAVRPFRLAKKYLFS